MNEREAFEAWESDGGQWPQAIERIGDNYKLMQAQSSWVAWQAAVAYERERIAKLLDAIREHWIKANGPESVSIGALDQIAEVIADGSYVA